MRCVRILSTDLVLRFVGREDVVPLSEKNLLRFLSWKEDAWEVFLIRTIELLFEFVSVHFKLVSSFCMHWLCCSCLSWYCLAVLVRVNNFYHFFPNFNEWTSIGLFLWLLLSWSMVLVKRSWGGCFFQRYGLFWVRWIDGETFRVICWVCHFYLISGLRRISRSSRWEFSSLVFLSKTSGEESLWFRGTCSEGDAVSEWFRVRGGGWSCGRYVILGMGVRVDMLMEIIQVSRELEASVPTSI